MKKLLHTLKPFAVEITNDYMLFACLIGPIFMGVAFKFLVPLLEGFLCGYFNAEAIISPYYIILDLLLSVMTPVMATFAGVMVILEETDCGVAKYFAVTPLGRSGYLFSRIVVPSLAAVVYDIILLLFFNVSGADFLRILLLSLGGGTVAVVIALIVASFSKNKMEGMVLVKLSGLLIVGIPAAYLISSPIRYCFGVLPSFWLSELCYRGNNLYIIPTVLTSAIISALLYGKFRQKLL